MKALLRSKVCARLSKVFDIFKATAKVLSKFLKEDGEDSIRKTRRSPVE